MADEIDAILYKIGSDINKVYTSSPTNPWCQTHYFKLIDGKCVGCEAHKAIKTLLDTAVQEARIDELDFLLHQFIWADAMEVKLTIDDRIKELKSTSKEDK